NRRSQHSPWDSNPFPFEPLPAPSLNTSFSFLRTPPQGDEKEWLPENHNTYESDLNSRDFGGVRNMVAVNSCSIRSPVDHVHYLELASFAWLGGLAARDRFLSSCCSRSCLASCCVTGVVIFSGSRRGGPFAGLGLRGRRR